MYFALWANSRSSLLAQQLSKGFMRNLWLCNKESSSKEEDYVTISWVELGLVALLATKSHAAAHSLPLPSAPVGYRGQSGKKRK